jgi:hypothetical protein
MTPDWNDFFKAVSTAFSFVGGTGTVFYFVDKFGKTKELKKERAI